MILPFSTDPLGLYCHVPFCTRTCDFCAFYQFRPSRGDVTAFLDGAAREMALYPHAGKVDTVFFGGGTPGLLSAKDQAVLGRIVLDGLDEPPGEWTVEMAPLTIKADKMRVLRELGVTRISIGVQSFDEAMLRRLGRSHAPHRAREALKVVREAGFENVNLDMIFAFPGQRSDELKRDLEQAIALEPEHISAYCLTYEEGARLVKKGAGGRSGEGSDREADLYLRAWDLLEEAGFEQYEISNFAIPGFECRHNMNTWKMFQWIGIGPSAASQYGGMRYANPADFELWLDGPARGRPAREDEVRLDARLLIEDAVVFGLRMSRGVDPARLQERFGEIDLSFLDPLWNDLASEGLLERRAGGDLFLTRKGRLVADLVGVEVMAAFEGDS